MREKNLIVNSFQIVYANTRDDTRKKDSKKYASANVIKGEVLKTDDGA